ncbi:vomeronasal type-2 receptor 26-like [Mantella aurantiaca]
MASEIAPIHKCLPVEETIIRLKEDVVHKVRRLGGSPTLLKGTGTILLFQMIQPFFYYTTNQSLPANAENLIPVCPPFDSSVCRYAKPGRPECYNDSQCTDSKKCCCSPTCGLRCLDPDIVKAGHCPNIQAKCMTEVTDKCDNDIDCPGSQKCCNICGKNCWDPEPEPFMVCPRNDDDPSVSLQCNLGTCTRDSDCEIGEKCCPSENGPSCVKYIKDVTYVCPAFNSSICHLARPGPNECHDDSQCTDSKKCCCSSNCGLKCVVPEKVKAGLCPIQRIMCLIRPTFTCKSDCDCPGSEKCCNICGKNCFEAVQAAQKSLGCTLQGWKMDTFTQPGDILIGGIFLVYSGYDFPLVSFQETPKPLSCKGFHIRYYRDVLGLKFAIDEINNSPDLLPNITLGFSLLESCMSELRAIGGVMSLLSGKETPVPRYNCHKTSSMVGIVGDMASALSLPIARILGVLYYPQISHGASSSSLSDKVNFPSFMRTVSSNMFQNIALSRLVNLFGWTWVGMLIVDNDVGEQGGRAIRAEIEKSGSCVSFAEKIHLSYSRAKVLKVVGIIRQSLANIIILHSTEPHVMALLDTLFDEGVTGKIFISSVSFTITPGLFSRKAWKVLNGTVGLMPKTRPMPGFESFLQSLHPAFTYPFIKPFWESAFHCSWSAKRTLENEANFSSSGSLCTEDGDPRMNIPELFEIYDLSYTYHAYLAAYAYAYSLHALLKCQPAQRVCTNVSSIRPWQVLKSLKKTPFRPPSGDAIAFDANGDVSASYDIVTIRILKGEFQLVTVGSFNPGAKAGHMIDINTSDILWNEQFSQVPQSHCSDSCPPGYRRVPRQGQPTCCFDCVLCSAGDISNRTDAAECLRCPGEQWSNEERNRCIPKIIEFLSYQEPLGIILVLIATGSSILALCILWIFIRFKDTPVIKATNRELSYILLVSLILCFLCCLVFIGRPSTITCLLRQTFFSVIFSISISSVLAKTIMVILAFKATRINSPLRKWLGPTIPRNVIGLCSALQISICTLWLHRSPPFPTMNAATENYKIILECDEGQKVFYYMSLGFMAFLAMISFLVAFLARNLPGGFNEAKLITFSMLVFCCVWISFIPAYLSTSGKYTVAVQIFAILASSVGLLSCIFLPKCCIILLRPERNSRQFIGVNKDFRHQRV